MKAKFITIEGIEGVGKTTNIEYIREWLAANNIEFISTREPGGTPLAEQVRDILLQAREEPVDACAELLLMFAARAQHINTVIKPALARGCWVLCDRFTDATFAYQGGGRKLPKAQILELEAMVQNELRPDLTFYLDIDVTQGLERARSRGELDRFEQEDIRFFEDVKHAYHERIDMDRSRFAVIDAGQPLREVQKQILVQLTKRLLKG